MSIMQRAARRVGPVPLGCAIAPGATQDAALITLVREGQLGAFGILYERHVASAYHLARQLCRSRHDADDLVSEAFARLLDTLKAKRGPDSAFRAYLLTALRHVAYDRTRRDRKVELTGDVGEVSGVRTELVSVPFVDTAVVGLERSWAAQAFARLPQRWREALTYTELLGMRSAQAAPMFGLTPNGMAALTYRARKALRSEYWRMHETPPAHAGSRDQGRRAKCA